MQGASDFVQFEGECRTKGSRFVLYYVWFMFLDGKLARKPMQLCLSPFVQIKLSYLLPLIPVLDPRVEADSESRKLPTVQYHFP